MSSQTHAEPLLEVVGLKKHFADTSSVMTILDMFVGSRDSRTVRAVDGVSFEMGYNETLGVVGESGCGKSTMGKSILRLIEPTSGTVRFKGEDITALSARELRDKRQDIQIVFQDPGAALNPRMKIGRLIAEPLENFRDLDRQTLDERVADLLEQVELPAEFKSRYPHELSGGQQQRVVIARALALDPDLIVADEPVTGLDVSIQANIINLLEDIQKERELSILFIAHDLTVVRHISDRVMVLYLGHVAEIGDADEVFENPQHPYTRALKGAIPSGRTGDGNLEIDVLSGEPPSPMDPPSGCPFHNRCPAYIGSICEAEYPNPVRLTDGRDVACHHFESGDDPIPDSMDFELPTSVADSVSGRETGSDGSDESPVEQDS